MDEAYITAHLQGEPKQTPHCTLVVIKRLKQICGVGLQEADMDEEGDAERAAQWDLAAADAAYKAQVEAALAQQRAVEEEQRLLLEQLEVLNHLTTHTLVGMCVCVCVCVCVC